MNFEDLSVEGIKSDIQSLTANFLNGDHLSLEVSEYVLSSIARLKKHDYYQCVLNIKKILNLSEVIDLDHLIIIKSGVLLSEEEKAVLTRYTNLCNGHATKIILFNETILYVPESMKEFTKEELYMYININLERFKHKDSLFNALLTFIKNLNFKFKHSLNMY